MSRSDGARARSRAWAVLGMNERPSGAIWSGSGRVVARGGLGDALYRRAAVHRGLVRRRARARRYGPREGAAPSLGRSWGSTTPRGRREGAGRGQRRRACEAAHWSSRAAGARASWGERREKEEGDRGVACRRRRGASSGALGRPEVAGGGWQGAATVPGRTVARSGACKWHAMAFYMPCGHGH